MAARPSLARRASGVLLHPTSLPVHGGGALGPGARAFADFLADCGQSWWQMLPVCPPDETGSPYASPSGFAGDPELAGAASARRAEQARLTKEERGEFERFREREAWWLADHSLFLALKTAHKGRAWTDWDAGLRARAPGELAKARRELRDELERHDFDQWSFARRWEDLRGHAASRGVGLIGDLPIYVSHDSADAWAHQELFQLDAGGRPRAVAGVPPDYFSADGQLWGNPLYDWEAHLKTGFSWWLARLRVVAERFDAVRLDHFIGFRNYWEIPAGAATARGGRWVRAPGDELFSAVRRELPGLGILAEDLGTLTPAVAALRDDCGFPGMRLGQFSFGGGPEDRPERWPENVVAYTGTHDNDTTRGWYEDDGTANNLRPPEAVARERAAFHEAAGGVPADPAWALTRMVWRSPARLALAPMQDLLALPGSARMNRPGTCEGNWRWRMDEGVLTAALAGRLGLLTGASGRAPEGV